MKKLALTENDIINDVQEFMRECDSDSLVELFGHLFGMSGDFNPNTEEYIFEPIDGEYCDHRAKELK